MGVVSVAIIRAMQEAKHAKWCVHAKYPTLQHNFNQFLAFFINFYVHYSLCSFMIRFLFAFNCLRFNKNQGASNEKHHKRPPSPLPSLFCGALSGPNHTTTYKRATVSSVFVSCDSTQIVRLRAIQRVCHSVKIHDITLCHIIPGLTIMMGNVTEEKSWNWPKRLKVAMFHEITVLNVFIFFLNEWWVEIYGNTKVKKVPVFFCEINGF